MCQGMAGVKEYFWFPQIGCRLAQLGFVTLIWDYRGVGESEGEPVTSTRPMDLDPPACADW